ncbi:hypothetical protein [Streptomyces sp. NPDC018693]|uniref:hypothetical protein n=1 Tax=unclassified Streptomyces TaxID=2593676 RepID=UPI0037BD0426
MRFLLVILRAALQHAVREDELPRNVARNVELSMELASLISKNSVCRRFPEAAGDQPALECG